MKFDENGTRVQDEVFIQQYRWINNTLSRVTFCIVNTQPNQNNTFSYLGNESDASVWPGSYKVNFVAVFVSCSFFQVVSHLMVYQYKSLMESTMPSL